MTDEQQVDAVAAPQDEAQDQPPETGSEEIRDPLAKLRAEEEKFARLAAKKDAQLEELKARLEQMESAQAEQFRQQLDDMKRQSDEALAALEAAKAEAAAARLDAMRSSVALATGLPPELASRLRGDDEEALRADAEKLAALIGSKSPTPRAANGAEARASNPREWLMPRSPFGDGGTNTSDKP